MSTFHKHLLACAASLVVFAAVAQAQSGNTPAGGDSQQTSQADNQNSQEQQQHAQQLRRMAMLAQRLNLSDEQKRQWTQIQRETSHQVKAARMDPSLSEEQMQAKLKEIHKQQKDQVLALLTPEQQEELKKFWEEQKQKQQPDKTSDSNSGSNPSVQNTQGNQDDLFADMQPDSGAPPNPPQPKKGTRK